MITSLQSELVRMEKDSDHVGISQNTKNIQLAHPTSFTGPPAKPIHFYSSCSAVNEVNRTQNWNHREKITSSQEDPEMLANASENQMTDNNNNPKAGSSSAVLNCWPLTNHCQRFPGENRRNKRLGPHAQQTKERFSKIVWSNQKDCPRKDMFLFWAQKVDETSKKPPRSLVSKKPAKQPRLVDNSPFRVPKERVESLKGEAQSFPSSAETIQRVTKKDLFPDSEVFRQLDIHVLHISEQLKSKQQFLSIQSTVSLLTKTAKSQLEKIRAIWVWLCHNIAYDVDGFLGFSEKIHIPEEVLQMGRGVCSGYAHLCHQMCKEAGLTCMEISGYGRGAGYCQGQSCQQKKSNHMWNAVKLEDGWFLLDACWGAGLVDVEKRLFIPRHEDFFFLTDPEHFIETHWPDEAEWQLIRPPIALEDFEKRVFKTPEFFKLHLALLSPDISVLKTDLGEATVSLTSTLSIEFTYQVAKLCQDGSKEDIGKTCGMLTASERKMVLKLYPPTEGLFDLQIFARPSVSPEPYTWVCSYQIECLESNGKEELPENPFPFWGLHPQAKELGIERCDWEGDLTIASSGTLKLGLQTNRPLSATYELVRRGLDTSLSRRCLVSQTEEEKLSCHVLCPCLGYYRLSVFVKSLNETELKNAANFLIWCSSPVDHSELFPPGLSMHCGTGISSRWMGLSNPSHTCPIIDTKQGRCNITFHIQPGLEVTATLGKDRRTTKTYPTERYVLVTHLERKVSISVLLPESGLYRVAVYGRTPDSNEFIHVCDYVVRCFTNPQWLPFPRVYSLWTKGSVLLQPRTGVLQEDSRVRFRIKMPKVYSAVVVGHSRTELRLTRKKVWEGDVSTGPAGTMLKVAVKFSPESTSMEVILSFDVECRPSTSGHSSG